jgi:hypothetical protein
MGGNDHGYCEESMDKLLILSQLKHAKWGRVDRKRAEMHFFGIRLPIFARMIIVNYERENRKIDFVSHIQQKD